MLEGKRGAYGLKERWVCSRMPRVDHEARKREGGLPQYHLTGLRQVVKAASATESHDLPYN